MVTWHSEQGKKAGGRKGSFWRKEGENSTGKTCILCYWFGDGEGDGKKCAKVRGGVLYVLTPRFTGEKWEERAV